MNISINSDDHKRLKYCHNRLVYRNSKKPTAVKVYTVANESKHLFIFGVPKINLHAEIRREFQRFGDIECIANETEHMIKSGIELELFTDCFRVTFKRLEHARKAKKIIDAKNFYGGILHISYAPEYESVEEFSQKLFQRRAEVKFRQRKNQMDSNGKRIWKNNDDSIKLSDKKKAKIEQQM